MGAIVDTLILGSEELAILQNEYPQCLATKLTEKDQVFQHYRVIIEGVDEDSYYDFLLDNGIAMSSRNFYSRIRSDERFATKMDLKMRLMEGTDG